jgi:hypothetical protein
VVAHSKSFVIFLVLAGYNTELVSGVRRAQALGTHVTVVTDRQHLGRVKTELALQDLPVTELRLVGIRRRPLDGLRNRARTLVRRAPRAVARRLHRWPVGVLRRLSAPTALIESTGRMGRQMEKATGGVADRLSDSVVEPAITTIGSGLSRIRQGRGVLKVVSDHIRLGRLLGVVCLDSASLFPGWVVSRRYELLPVVTSFPTDWDAVVVEQLAVLEQGSRW